MNIQNYELKILQKKFERLENEGQYRTGAKKFPKKDYASYKDWLQKMGSRQQEYIK